MTCLISASPICIPVNQVVLCERLKPLTIHLYTDKFFELIALLDQYTNTANIWACSIAHKNCELIRCQVYIKDYRTINIMLLIYVAFWIRRYQCYFTVTSLHSSMKSVVMCLPMITSLSWCICRRLFANCLLSSVPKFSNALHNSSKVLRPSDEMKCNSLLMRERSFGSRFTNS